MSFLWVFICLTFINQASEQNLNSENSKAFAFELSKNLVPEDENAILSPLSISACFSLAYPAASGETAKEIQKVFKYTTPTSALNYFIELGQSYESRSEQPPKEYDGYYSYPPPPVLALTQKLFLNVNSELQAEYMSTVKNLVQPLNFGDEANAVSTINDYVSKSTHGLINEVLQTVDPNTNVVAVNTLYLKARWETEFQKYNNQIDDFYPTAEFANVKSLPFPGQPTYMRRTAEQKIGYYEDDFRQMIELKFENSRLSMIFNLPKDDEAFAGGELELTEYYFNKIYPKMAENAPKYKLNIWIPKFKISARYEKTLVDTLKSMGLKTSFDATRASFPGMSKAGEPVAIDQLIHQAVIEIDETGVEAAAVTVMAMAGASFFEPPPLVEKEFKANHPFQFYIYDAQDDNILFMGQVTDPTGMTSQSTFALAQGRASADAVGENMEEPDNMVWRIIISGVLVGLFLSVIIYGFGSIYYSRQTKKELLRNDDYKLDEFDLDVQVDEM